MCARIEAERKRLGIPAKTIAAEMSMNESQWSHRMSGRSPLYVEELSYIIKRLGFWPFGDQAGEQIQPEPKQQQHGLIDEQPEDITRLIQVTNEAMMDGNPVTRGRLLAGVEAILNRRIKELSKDASAFTSLRDHVRSLRERADLERATQPGPSSRDTKGAA